MDYYRTPNFNPKCRNCNLSEGCAVNGQSIKPFDQIKLIVISAYPSPLEIEEEVSLAKNQDKYNYSAGTTARMFLNKTFEECLDNKYLPFEDYIYYTNALKCSPQRGKDKINITNTHIKKCKETWLDKELELFHPETPILLAGGEAVKSIFGFKTKIYDSSNKILYYQAHPVVVMSNPVEWGKHLLKIVTNPNAQEDLDKLKLLKQNTKHKENIVLNTQYWLPYPLGSGGWFIKRDLNLVKQIVLDFINKNGTEYK